jgi:phosphoribosyl 1,2-cyclic phosphodiesterase
VAAESIEAICLTHEHGDHRAAVGILHRKLGAELYSNAGTIDALSNESKFHGLPWNEFLTGHPFEIGDLTLEPFRVPHDSFEPVGFVVSCGDCRVGIATDMGVATSLVQQRLLNCDALVLEANHDEQMLRNSERPWSLKQRIAGRQGHLSNSKAGELLVEVAGSRLKTVFLAHISGDCNTPELAIDTVRKILKENSLEHIDVRLSYGSCASELIRVG